jgi:hypothetical protein
MLTNFEKEMVKIYNETTENETVFKKFLNSYLPGKQSVCISYTVKLVYNDHSCDPPKKWLLYRDGLPKEVFQTKLVLKLVWPVLGRFWQMVLLLLRQVWLYIKSCLVNVVVLREPAGYDLNHPSKIVN